MPINIVGDNMDLLVVLLRTIFFYFFILICFRIMGKREIGQLSISDLTISILIAELVAISIENREDNTILTIMPIILLVILEVLFAFVQLKSNRLRRFFDGKPSIIIDKGKLNLSEMVKQRYSIDDLLLALRAQNIKSIYDIDYALLEPNCKLSVFKKSPFNINDEYPLPLIIDGTIENSTLNSLKKSKKWLNDKLAEYNVALNDILYAFYKGRTIYIVKKAKK